MRAHVVIVGLAKQTSGMITCLKLPNPLEGSQPSVAVNKSISISAIQKAGIDVKMTVATRIKLSKKEFCLIAIAIPRSSEITMVRANDVSDKKSVAPIREAIIELTDCLV